LQNFYFNRRIIEGKGVLSNDPPGLTNGGVRCNEPLTNVTVVKAPRRQSSVSSSDPALKSSLKSCVCDHTRLLFIRMSAIRAANKFLAFTFFPFLGLKMRENSGSYSILREGSARRKCEKEVREARRIKILYPQTSFLCCAFP
jgi:hypothetical protein